MAMFRWVPYTKGSNKCELNCMPRNEVFFYKLKNQVIDGTLCDNEKTDICVNGKCVVSIIIRFKEVWEKISGKLDEIMG